MFVVMRKENIWRSTNSTAKAKALLIKGFKPVAKTNTKEQANQMILGLRSDELVSSLLNHLPNEIQTIVKVEIASIAEQYKNGRD